MAEKSNSIASFGSIIILLPNVQRAESKIYILKLDKIEKAGCAKDQNSALVSMRTRCPTTSQFIKNKSSSLLYIKTNKA